MREIKFRGKRIDNGEWVYGNYIRKNDPRHTEPIFWCALIQDYALSAYEVNPETVGQYTGLKDKNGVEIYENDTVLWYDEPVWIDDYITDKVAIREKVTFDGGGFQCLLSMPSTEFEVIGNIHEEA